jgi:hypothetical protein
VPKVVKNRVHLDVQDGSPDHVMMADRERNEFEFSELSAAPETPRSIASLHPA